MTSWPTYKTAAAEEAEVADLFSRDIADHQLNIVHDADGLIYLKARKPNDGVYWFDVTATPTSVAINGDMGSFMFTRYGSSDQLALFRRDGLNMYYFNQKRTAGDAHEYKVDAYIEAVVDAAKEYLADADDDEDDVLQPNELAETALGWKPEHTETRENKIIAAVRSELLSWPPESHEEAYEALASADVAGITFDPSELDLTRPTFHYLWCLHALLWTVRNYDEQKKTAAEAA